MDFTNLSLHQTKRLEMEAQVKVLELEKQLENEKKKLYQLRKQHYQLAGENQTNFIVLLILTWAMWLFLNCKIF